MLNSQQHAMPPGQQPNPGQGAPGSITSPQSKTYKGIPLGYSYSHMTQDMREIYFTLTPDERAEYQRRTRELRIKEDTEFKATVSETDRIVEEIKVDTTDIKVGVQQILEKLDKQPKPVTPEPQPDNKEKEKEKEEDKSWIVRVADKLRKHNAKIDAKIEAIKYIVSSLADRAGQIVKWLPTLWIMLATLVRALEDLWKEVILPKIEEYISPGFRKLMNTLKSVKEKLMNTLKSVKEKIDKVAEDLSTKAPTAYNAEVGNLHATKDVDKYVSNSLAKADEEAKKGGFFNKVKSVGRKILAWNLAYERDKAMLGYTQSWATARAINVATKPEVHKVEPQDTSVVTNTGDVIVEEQNVIVNNNNVNNYNTNNNYTNSPGVTGQ